jgi:hypothetical protein
MDDRNGLVMCWMHGSFELGIPIGMMEAAVSAIKQGALVGDSRSCMNRTLLGVGLDHLQPEMSDESEVVKVLGSAVDAVVP